MNNVNCYGLLVKYDRGTRKLVVIEQKISGTGIARESQLLEFSLAGTDEANMSVVEQTLGQLLLYSLEKLTPEGLGFGSYADLFRQICEDNFEVFCRGLDLSSKDDQYDLATMMFSRGRRIGSWEKVEHAINLFVHAAAAGHEEAKKFLEEDLPVVLPRLKEKLKPQIGQAK